MYRIDNTVHMHKDLFTNHKLVDILLVGNFYVFTFTQYEKIRQHMPYLPLYEEIPSKR
jgi:hypothetical protein